MNPVAQFVVLNAFQAAAADLALAGGKMSCTGLEPLKLSDGISKAITAYAAGTASISDVDFTAASLGAVTNYQLSVEFPDASEFPNGGQNANQLSRIRSYNWSAGTTAPSAQDVAEAIRDMINNDLYSKVTATAAAGVLTITQKATSLANFDGPIVINVGGAQGATLAYTTPYVSPAGTPTVLEREKVPVAQISAAGQYKKYDITYRKLTTRGVANGAKAFIEVRAVIYANTLGANYAAFNTELLAILAGTHTPVADYLGI
jgi:hypothetical protein